MQKIVWVKNKMQKNNVAASDYIELNEVIKARIFHKSFPGYTKTPLQSLENLAKFLGVAGIYVKDESYRFGLNAFKVLGGAFAIAKYLTQKFNISQEKFSYAELSSPQMRKKFANTTFVTATDGNHGRGVAWAAKRLGCKAVVYMPKGSSPVRLQNIIAEGAKASITNLNYDEAVRMAAAKAKAYGWIVIQDTAWEDYDDIPAWIIQGYGTIADEALEQVREKGVDKPTHIFLQAGVGSFAAAMQGYFVAKFGRERPKTVIVEPNLANCFYQSVTANNGGSINVTGYMPTIMAGLACGEPNPLSWRLLRDCSDMFFSCPDEVTAKGMRMLGNPLGSDQRIVAGESGAVTAGLLAYLLKDKSLHKAKESLEINKNSHILLISTEGDTDPLRYRDIVWEGCYPSFE